MKNKEDLMLEYTISGSYYNSKKEIVDFADVKVFTPENDLEHGIASMHLRSRYVQKALKAEVLADGSKKYPDYITSIKQVFVDTVNATKGKYSFVGKDIKKLNMEELQDLATRKDLRAIPLPNSSVSLREALEIAYKEYSEKINGKKIPQDANFASLPSIFLDGTKRTDLSALKNQDEKENLKQVTMSIEELKIIANGRNIKYPPDITAEELTELIFSVAR